MSSDTVFGVGSLIAIILNVILLMNFDTGFIPHQLIVGISAVFTLASLSYWTVKGLFL